MIDKEFNPNHCRDCKTQNACAGCYDGYEVIGHTKPVPVGLFLTRFDWDSNGTTVMFYAQRKALDFFKKFIK